MASWQARLAAFFVRHRIKPALGDMHDIARVRAVFATRLPVPRGVRFTAGHLGGVPGEWVEAADPIAAGAARRLTVLYLHGGGFIHADIAHLLFNGFTLWAFAFPLERTHGSGRFLMLYTAGLLVSSFGTWLKHREDPEYRSLGASGAILAVLFASIVYFPTHAIYILPIPVPIPAPLFAVAYLVYTVYASRQARGRINHDAHLSGALTGLAFVAVTDPQAVARAIRAVFG